MRPILILTHSHALVGCWLEELSFPSSKEENLLPTFKADVYLAYLKRVLPERDLSTLSASSTEELVKSYREEMAKIQSLAVNVVAASITEKYPKNADTFASSTNAYKLTKLAKNGGRGAIQSPKHRRRQ